MTSIFPELFPNEIVAITLFVAPSITDTVALLVFAIYI
ncbi:hypothetical protein bcere0024_051230 [Bacillus cereus Rock4-18]|nr:hypothetical protein bcere0024_051230 [Bacillus cereus Rock4-18]